MISEVHHFSLISWMISMIVIIFCPGVLAISFGIERISPPLTSSQ